jgi:replication-associated recombination protein RarA
MPASEAEGRAQDYMPEHRCYYRPGDRGYEKEVRERLNEWDGALTSAPTEDRT